MNFNRRKRPPLEISITPMVDVVFLLLIFFMVTTTFNRETKIEINLPEANGENVKEEDRQVALMIDEEGLYYVADKNNQYHQLLNNDPATLKQALVNSAGKSRAMPFILSADGKTPHQAVITALDVASQLGFQRITFSTKKPSHGL